MAPEVCRHEAYNESVDIYSMSMIVYEMTTGCAPFGCMNKKTLIKKVINGGDRPDLILDDYGYKLHFG